MTEYVYEVRSDKPLSLVNGIGNVPVVSAFLYAQPLGREGWTVSGTGLPQVSITARLVRDGSEAVT
jgi:hypothetical protein